MFIPKVIFLQDSPIISFENLSKHLTVFSPPSLGKLHITEKAIKDMNKKMNIKTIQLNLPIKIPHHLYRSCLIRTEPEEHESPMLPDYTTERLLI